MSVGPTPEFDPAARRRGVRRTVLALSLVAGSLYLYMIARGVLGAA